MTLYGLPEKEVGAKIYHQLTHMESNVERFRAAVDLAANAREWRNDPGNSEAFWTIKTWGDIARRDAGMTIQDFKRAMANVKSLHKQSKMVKNHVQMAELEAVFLKFNQRFPGAKQIRNALGHPADVYNTPDRNSFVGDTSSLQRHGFFAPDNAKLMISGGFDNRAVVTVDGKLLSFDFDHQTSAFLKELQDEYFRAFYPVLDALHAKHIERMTNLASQQEPPAES
jgi:hypothetical protein